MPIDPVKIPQNVQIEDRVVGPLSLRQLIIIMVGGGFSYILYSMIQKTYGSVPVPIAIAAWTPCAITAMFALVKINDLSLMRICFLLLEKTQKPSVRTWAPRQGIAINIRVSGKLDKEGPKKDKAAPKAQDSIEALSAVVDNTLPTTEADMDPSEPATKAIVDDVAPSATKPATSKTPVDPTRIKTDTPVIEPEQPNLSDLSVFRDIFPSNK